MGRFLLLALLTALVFYALNQLPQQPLVHTQSQPGLLFPQLAAALDQVEQVDIQTATANLQLRKQEQTWRLVSKADYPVNRERLTTLLTALAELQPSEAKTNDPQRHAQLDLGDPAQGGKAVKLSLATAQGQVLASLLLGKSQPDKADPSLRAVYVRQTDATQTWRVVGNLKAETDPLAWVERSLLALDTRRIQQLALTLATGETLRMQRESAETKDYHLADLPAGASLKSPSALSALVFQAANLTLEDISAVPADFQASERYTLTTFDGLQVEAQWVAASDAWLLRLKAQAVAPTLTGEPQRPFLKPEEITQTVAELNLRWGRWVYHMPAMTHDAIFKSLPELASVPPPVAVDPEPVTEAAAQAMPVVEPTTTPVAGDTASAGPAVAPGAGVMPILPNPAPTAVMSDPVPQVEPSSASLTPEAGVTMPPAAEPSSTAILDAAPVMPAPAEPASVSLLPL